MYKPNFFIVGAPKCGTTALSDYLRCHPNAFLPYPKEPHYFCDDFPNHRVSSNSREYQELFRSCSATDIAIGEASVWYLYSKVAIRNIYNFNKDSKLIVLLRNPIDLYCSLHAQLIYNLHEDQTDLRIAWDLQNRRKNGFDIPNLCTQPEILFYQDILSLGIQCKRLLDVFPRNQVKFILFDDLVNSTQSIYYDTLRFLQLPPHEKIIFEQKNERRIHKSRILSKIIERPPFIVKILLNYIRRYFGINTTNFTNSIRELNRSDPLNQDIDITLRQNIASSLEADIKLLENILGENLSSWYKINSSDK